MGIIQSRRSKAPTATIRLLEQDLGPDEMHVSRLAAVEVLVKGKVVAQIPASTIDVKHPVDGPSCLTLTTLFFTTGPIA